MNIFSLIKLLCLLSFCVTIVKGSAIRNDNGTEATTLDPELSLDEAAFSTVKSRVERDLSETTINPDVAQDETERSNRSRREATTEIFLDEQYASTVISESRVKREATTLGPEIFLDEQDATTIRGTRVKREVTTLSPEILQDEQEATTIRESRVKREATTLGPEIFLDEQDATTIRETRVKREVTTLSPEISQDEQDSTAATESRVKRDATTFGPEVFLDEQDATTVAQSRVKREATTFGPEIFLDESDGTTIGSRMKRETPFGTESSTNEILKFDQAETTDASRIKRQIVEELVTESTSSNEIFNDATELATSSSLVLDKSFDDDDSDEENFKYPEPILENVTTSGNPIPDDENIPNSITKVAEQNIILGNRSCECGTSTKRIVGGESVPISHLSWTVALIRKRNTTTRGPYCGGTLVSNRYVVTASHCVDGFKPEKIEVWLNEEDFRVEDENLSGTIRVNVEEIIMHPEYDRKKIDNDIALLRLAEPIDIEGAVRPACLPADNTHTYEGEEAIVAGWGATEQGGNVSSTLQKVSVPILSNKVCNWRTLYLGRITDNQLCAGEMRGSKDSCQGDSGGPLVISMGEFSKKVLVGVVSYGFGCAKPLAPGVYTRVSQYPQWILENSKDAEYCSA